jgi:hypothetical protein
LLGLSDVSRGEVCGHGRLPAEDADHRSRHEQIDDDDED